MDSSSSEDSLPTGEMKVGLFQLRRTQAYGNLAMPTGEEAQRQYKNILHFDGKMDFDVNKDNSQQHLMTIYETDESASDDSTPTCSDNVCLQYMGSIVPYHSRLLKANSSALRKLVKKADLPTKEDGELPVLNIPAFKLCHSFEVFQGILEAIRTGTWSLQKGFEEEISFYTYVSLYLIGVHWEMEKLRKFAINCIGILPKYIMDKPNGLLTGAESVRQHLHMISLTRAIDLAYQYPRHSTLWKALYACGDELEPKLVESPNFNSWVDEFEEGKSYMRNICIRRRDAEREWERSMARRQQEQEAADAAVAARAVRAQKRAAEEAAAAAATATAKSQKQTAEEAAAVKAAKVAAANERLDALKRFSSLKRSSGERRGTPKLKRTDGYIMNEWE